MCTHFHSTLPKSVGLSGPFTHVFVLFLVIIECHHKAVALDRRRSRASHRLQVEGSWRLKAGCRKLKLRLPKSLRTVCPPPRCELIARGRASHRTAPLPPIRTTRHSGHIFQMICACRISTAFINRDHRRRAYIFSLSLPPRVSDLGLAQIDRGDIGSPPRGKCTIISADVLRAAYHHLHSSLFHPATRLSYVALIHSSGSMRLVVRRRHSSECYPCTTGPYDMRGAARPRLHPFGGGA
jgi:hypothetical protein